MAEEERGWDDPRLVGGGLVVLVNPWTRDFATANRREYEVPCSQAEGGLRDKVCVEGSGEK
jgi:hypothetical protein